jgi:hypothetical protein
LASSSVSSRVEGGMLTQAAAQLADGVGHRLRTASFLSTSRAHHVFAQLAPLLGIVVEQAREFVGAREQVEAAHLVDDAGKQAVSGLTPVTWRASTRPARPHASCAPTAARPWRAGRDPVMRLPNWRTTRLATSACRRR